MLKNQPLSLSILLDGDKKLVTPTKKITKITKKDREVGNAMLTLMKQSGAIGLASNQVGYMKSIITISIGPENYIMFNPEIVNAVSELGVSKEGCMSLPGELHDVVRSKKIQVKWQNSKGEGRVKWFHGLMAYCIQHEESHIKGRRFLDETIESIKQKRKEQSEKE